MTFSLTSFRRSRLLLTVFGVLLSPLLATALSLTPLLTDNAVLQRDTAVAVWGEADPGEWIVVTFAGQSHETVADPKGQWAVRLTPMQANLSGTLSVRGTTTLTRTNLVTGDVWLCSGQSNMGMKVRESRKAADEMAAANLPDIRQFLVPRQPSPQPQPDTWIEAEWVPASPATAGEFTAGGFFFAREVHRELGVPIGLINSSWGGTPIQPWMSTEALQAYPGYPQLLERKQAEIAAWPERKKQIEADIQRWETETAADRTAGKTVRPRPWNPGPPDSGQYMPAQLYNGMIHPLVRYPIKGVLWYQGEANAGGGAAGAADYTDLQSRLIAGWRKDWGQAALPFYFVQLAGWGNFGDTTGRSWAFFREGQANVLDRVPHTGMAVAVDIGDTHDIHPKNKQEVGRRLALLALAGTYGCKVVAHGPAFASSSIEGDCIRLRFEHAEGGLMVRPNGPLRGFEIAGADGTFLPAEARIEQDTVVVRSAAVERPVHVRYGWSNDPAVSLFNGAGLPTVPFRTDNLSR